jgi:hypothetical protein
VLCGSIIGQVGRIDIQIPLAAEAGTLVLPRRALREDAGLFRVLAIPIIFPIDTGKGKLPLVLFESGDVTCLLA